ncbi:hypothetical protein [Kurthia massiliensis]|uniref:hypothetical protein n=1 Tax=Kurthia massiliensis TaxID=1033739 RepID=UPI00028865F3|nr:hypothetical protein [Kurthia massiliensis]
MYHINIFCAQRSYEWVKYIDKLAIKNCTFHYYTYTSFEQLHALLRAHLSEGDGALFSGQIPYFFAQANMKETTVPMAYFDISERDFYRLLTELFYTRDLRLKEIAIDFCYEENGYLGIHEWREDDLPQLFSQTMNSYATSNIIESVVDWHTTLYQKGKTKLSLTRVAEMVDQLAARGVPYIFVHPSPYAVEKTIKRFIQQLDMAQLIQNQVVVAAIHIPVDKTDVETLEYRHISLYKAILDLKQQHPHIIVHREATAMMLLTTYAHFIALTKERTTCELVAYLSKQLSFPVKVGWGIGQTLQQSRAFAQQAVQRCTSKHTEGYMKGETYEIGPLLAGVTLQYDASRQQRLKDISISKQLPFAQLQKIDAVIQTLQTPILNGELLADHLNMTVRSANRILQNLCQKQLATELPNVVASTRGRPKKFYKIYLGKESI